MKSAADKSMLDTDPEGEDDSDAERGGVSRPELDVVQVLERERAAGPGREKTGMEWTVETLECA
jgi:hypothetical protein